MNEYPEIRTDVEARATQILKTGILAGYAAGGPISDGSSLPAIESGCEYPVVFPKLRCGARRWIDTSPESPYRVPNTDEYVCSQPAFHQGLGKHLDKNWKVAWNDGDEEVQRFGEDDE